MGWDAMGWDDGLTTGSQRVILQMVVRATCKTTAAAVIILVPPPTPPTRRIHTDQWCRVHIVDGVWDTHRHRWPPSRVAAHP